MICKDLRDMVVSEDAWYREATSSRTGWRAPYRAHFVEEAARDDHHRMTGADGANVAGPVPTVQEML